MISLMDQTKTAILRYLGRREQYVPEALSCMLDECLALMQAAAAPRHVHMVVSALEDGNGVSLGKTGLVLLGKDITRHLRGCSRVVLMAATLGAGADAIIRKWEHIDLTRALVLDACASQLIEQYCDETEQNIHADASVAGFAATRRTSPGYGDLPLDIQPQILDTLNACIKIGLTCTERLILLPRKSVTAIIGLKRQACGSSVLAGKTEEPSPCLGCLIRCNFRKDEPTNECS